MGHSKRYRESDSDDSGTSDTDTNSATSSSEEEEKPRHRRSSHRRHSSHAALLHHHRAQRHRAQNDTGSVYLWGAAVAVVVVLLLGAGWYFLLGPGSDESATSSDSASLSAGGGATGGAGATKGASSTGGGTAGGTPSGAAAGSDATKSAAASGDQSSSGSSKASASASASTSTSSGGSPAASGTSSSGSGDKPRSGQYIGGFYETWGKLAVSDIPFEKFAGSLYRADTHLYWFVAAPGDVAAKGALDLADTGNKKADFLSGCKAAGVKAMLSIGGWTDSVHFSKLVASEESRKDFAQSIKSEVEESGWEGVDLDWEYPGAPGATQDFDLTNDLPNYLEFFKALREALGSDILITTDTSSSPWLDPATGKPSTDLSAFNDVVDFFGVMTYDAWGAGTVSGPNFPLSAKCNPTGSSWEYPAAMQAWLDAGISKSQLVVGIAGYGHSWTVADFDDTGAAAKASSPVFQVGVAKASITFTEIEAAGSDGSKQDDCTGSTYMYKDGVITVWDNAENVKAKAATSKDKGLAGCMLYAITGDKDNALVDAMISAC